jgi:hypothetical protein
VPGTPSAPSRALAIPAPLPAARSLSSTGATLPLPAPLPAVGRGISVGSRPEIWADQNVRQEEASDNRPQWAMSPLMPPLPRLAAFTDPDPL